MAKLHLRTSDQNHDNSDDHAQHQPGAQTAKVGSTLYRKVAPKNEIIITRQQLSDVSWLFRQYDLTKPGWLRTKFISNQRRRKVLNGVLVEAGLDSSCCNASLSSDWSGQLHSVWHQVNGVPLCK